MIKVSVYEPSHKNSWDRFVEDSSNALFLHHRDYIEYHGDRFLDCSLVCQLDGKLVALLPAVADDETVISHPGLTFGGLLLSPSVKTTQVKILVSALMEKLKKLGKKKLVLKPVPIIYQQSPTAAADYVFHQHLAINVAKEIATVIPLKKYKLPQKKAAGARKAIRDGLVIEKSHDFRNFFQIVDKNLFEKYGTLATHTSQEMEHLSNLFADDIVLWSVLRSGKMVGGIIIYVYGTCLHAQYIAQTATAQASRALDLIIHHIFTHYTDKTYFSFGISTESHGTFLNADLINSKEEYSCSSISFDTYEIQL